MRAGILDVVETNRKLWKEKSSVPGPGPSATVGKALLSPQRHTQVLDVNPFANTAFSDVQTAVLAEFGQAKKNDAKCFADLNVTLDRQFIPQWHSKYFSLIMPFEIPRMVSGPDYPRRPKWRRGLESALVTPTTFMRGLCRRIELQIANSWTCVPIVRSVWYKQVIEAKAVATGSFQVSLQGNAGLEAGGDQTTKDVFLKSVKDTRPKCA